MIVARLFVRKEKLVTLLESCSLIILYEANFVLFIVKCVTVSNGEDKLIEILEFMYYRKNK